MRLKNQLLIENGLIYNMNLKDQNVLITGAAEGLGLAISNAFDNESANLFLKIKILNNLIPMVLEIQKIIVLI